MDYTDYIQRIERAIRELEDIKARMTQAEVEFVIPRCNPIWVVNPAPGSCIPDSVKLEPKSIEIEITAWIQDAVNRILAPPQLPEPESESS